MVPSHMVASKFPSAANSSGGLSRMTQSKWLSHFGKQTPALSEIEQLERVGDRVAGP